MSATKKLVNAIISFAPMGTVGQWQSPRALVGRVPVADEHGVVALDLRACRRAPDARVGGCTADHEAGRAEGVEAGAQVGVGERVEPDLGDHGVTVARAHLLDYLPGVRARDERPGLVLDPQHRHVGAARPIDEAADPADHAVTVVGAAGVAVLDVDDEEDGARVCCVRAHASYANGVSG